MSNLCKLCQDNPLENVGSHIFTESIIRTALNQDGYTKREDKELIYEISIDKIGLDFFGSGVLPEKIEEITGKQLSDEEIEQNKNPFINRNLVCRKCERKFGPIESEFTSKIYSKILKKNNEELNYDTCNYISFENEKWLALQFVIINVWRASASNYNDWKLNTEQEEYLREFILLTADKDIESIIKKTVENKDRIKHFNFVLNYFIQKFENLSENGVLIDTWENPFFILLNRLSLIFDFIPLNEIKLPELLKEIIDENFICIIPNSESDELRIGINSDEQRTELYYRVSVKAANDILKNIERNFIDTHILTFGFPPPFNSMVHFKQTVVNYVNEEGKITIPGLLEVVIDVIKDCANSYF
ncbi:hypothetical protein EKL32_22570 [Flavobacterium sp. GSN2]|nr:hypothetical protein EKL32_22570 [Flavobacterium sp. GSN2]